MATYRCLHCSKKASGRYLRAQRRYLEGVLSECAVDHMTAAGAAAYSLAVILALGSFGLTLTHHLISSDKY